MWKSGWWYFWLNTFLFYHETEITLARKKYFLDILFHFIKKKLEDCPYISLLKHSIVKICTLKVSVLGLTLQVSVDLSYYIFYSWYQLKVQTRPAEDDFPCIFKSQPVICTLVLFLFFTSTWIPLMPSLFHHSSTVVHIHLMVSVNIF